MKKLFLLSILLILFSLAAAAQEKPDSTKPKKPEVIIIAADTIRASMGKLQLELKQLQSILAPDNIKGMEKRVDQILGQLDSYQRVLDMLPKPEEQPKEKGKKK